MQLTVITIVVLTILQHCGTLDAGILRDLIEDDTDKGIRKKLRDRIDEKIDLGIFGRRIHGRVSAQTGRVLAKYEGIYPEEQGSYVEGDVLIPIEENQRYNVLITQSSYWPNAVVPYEVVGNFTADELERIENAFDTYHEKTCIRFIPRTNQTDYISIDNAKTGCFSTIGRKGDKQIVNLQTPQCLKVPGTILHEFLHVLGFMHEQSRTDRDDYVRILTENIVPDDLSNFNKRSASEISALGVSYDYSSVLHYSKRSFSIDGSPTIVALHNTEDAGKMGQRQGFSPGDIAKINNRYVCST